jgi:hypothetical protein
MLPTPKYLTYLEHTPSLFFPVPWLPISSTWRSPNPMSFMISRSTCNWLQEKVPKHAFSI